jgi:hypothetical protein
MPASNSNSLEFLVILSKLFYGMYQAGQMGPSKKKPEMKIRATRSLLIINSYICTIVFTMGLARFLRVYQFKVRLVQTNLP